MSVRIILSKDEQQALERLAWNERRRVNQQAALLIRQKLIECGLLPSETPQPIATSPAQPQHPQAVRS